MLGDKKSYNKLEAKKKNYESSYKIESIYILCLKCLQYLRFAKIYALDTKKDTMT